MTRFKKLILIVSLIISSIAIVRHQTAILLAGENQTHSNSEDHNEGNRAMNVYLTMGSARYVDNC